jgi:hypothetical protein
LLFSAIPYSTVVTIRIFYNLLCFSSLLKPSLVGAFFTVSGRWFYGSTTLTENEYFPGVCSCILYAQAMGCNSLSCPYSVVSSDRVEWWVSLPFFKSLQPEFEAFLCNLLLWDQLPFWLPLLDLFQFLDVAGQPWRLRWCWEFRCGCIYCLYRWMKVCQSR